MSRVHPDLVQLAELTTALYLGILERGTMDGRDSDGNTIQVPISAAMMGKIQDWLRQHQVTMDLGGDQGNDIGEIARRMKERGVAGKLPTDDPEENVA